LRGGVTRRRGASGGILAYSELLRRLEAGELFSPGSWRTEQLRGAAYELRLASDLMFIRGPGGKSTKYGVGDRHPDPVILDEGEVALVSSVERCRFPSDVAANITVKWDLARKGLLVLTGGFVNPRFGLTNIDGHWVPKDDERLHFLVVNLGSDPQALIPNETRLASVQFLSMIGDPDEQVAPSTQGLIAREYTADAPVSALAIFRELRRQRKRLDRLTASYEKLEHGFQPLLTFGLYILSVTFLGVILAGMFQLASEQKAAQFAKLFAGHWPFTIVVIFIILAITIIGKAFLDLLTRIVTRVTGSRVRK
jgi:deoxycytidine triphosphate deaminase